MFPRDEIELLVINAYSCGNELIVVVPNHSDTSRFRNNVDGAYPFTILDGINYVMIGPVKDFFPRHLLKGRV